MEKKIFTVVNFFNYATPLAVALFGFKTFFGGAEMTGLLFVVSAILFRVMR